MSRRSSQRGIEETTDEHIRRMGEPEPYRSLRLQKERIEHEQAEAAERAYYEREAEQLRREIKRAGHVPCV